MGCTDTASAVTDLAGRDLDERHLAQVGQTVGVLGGLAVFAMFTLADVLARRRASAAESVHAHPDGLPTSGADRP